MPMLMQAGNCCGARVLYGFARNYAEMTKSVEEKAREYFKKCTSERLGIVIAILNQAQRANTEQALLNAGFKLSADANSIPNPNMNDTTRLFLYVWTKEEGTKHFLSLYPKKESMTPEEKEAKRLARNAARRAKYRAERDARYMNELMNDIGIRL